MSFHLAGPAFAAHPSDMSLFVPFAKLLTRKDKSPKAVLPSTPLAAVRKTADSSPRTSSEAPAYSSFPKRTSSLTAPPPPYDAHTTSSSDNKQYRMRRTDERVAQEVKAFGM